MRLRRTIAIALLAAMLGATGAIAPTAAVAAAPLGSARVAAPDGMSKTWRKLLDYLSCIGSIVAAKDGATALGAATVCGNVMKTWYEE